jgi:hypothetical protein
MYRSIPKDFSIGKSDIINPRINPEHEGVRIRNGFFAIDREESQTEPVLSPIDSSLNSYKRTIYKDTRIHFYGLTVLIFNIFKMQRSMI